ncbi:MAG TPA: hypothetical protein VHX38_39105 [Pseudonocardiaceae bacterium]|nr:hypothetical protein [Pseudonocardiaceae bacterium]
MQPAQGLLDKAESAVSDAGNAVSSAEGTLESIMKQAKNHELAARNVLYCGLGHHVSVVDGSTITSSLTVGLQQFPEKANLRLILRDFVMAKYETGERGQVDVEGRPVLFVESTRELPAPQLPEQESGASGATSPVFQLEATVPAEDATKLVTMEFSTPFVSYGTEFRAMMVQLAASVSSSNRSHQPNTGRCRDRSATGWDEEPMTQSGDRR